MVFFLSGIMASAGLGALTPFTRAASHILYSACKCYCLDLWRQGNRQKLRKLPKAHLIIEQVIFGQLLHARDHR